MEDSSLLCLENNTACFDDFESSTAYGYYVISPPPSWDHIKNLNFNDQNLSKDNHGSEPFMGFLVLTDETVGIMVEREREQLPRGDYLRRLRSGDLDLSVVRREAIDWIWKAHSYFSFEPRSFCLSVNFLDRFLSVYELPRGGSWAVQLLAVACLSIAAKMEESKVPPFVDLQIGKPKFLFEPKAVQRMELLVLTTLRWRMQALTPFSFVDYFLSKIARQQPLAESSISRSMELILGIVRCADFLEFRPSEIVAAVATFVSRESQGMEIDEALSSFSIVDKERVLKCLQLIQDFSSIKLPAKYGGGNLAVSVPQSPVGVLDATCLSTKSDESTIGSFTKSSEYSSNTKRKRSEMSDREFCKRS